MKKAVIAVILLAVALGGGTWYLLTNLDAIVERAIENAGTNAVGSAVEVGAVSIDLRAGTATVRDFTIANPEGYSNDAMLRFSELSVALDLANLSRESIGIRSVVARQPHVLFEQRNGVSNFDVISERLGGSAPAQPAEPTPDNLRLTIGEVLVEDVGATLSSDLLPARVEVRLGNVTLQNLAGTPDEVARQVLRPLVTQLSRNAGIALLSAGGRELLERAGDGVGAAAGRVLDGLGNLLNRNAGENDGQ